MKSQRAKNLLLDDFFISEMAEIEQSQIDIIVNSAPHEVEEREDAYRMQRAVKSIMAHFKSLSQTDEIEKRRWKIL
jgi:predicted phosphoribosyltransferase